MKLLDIYTPGVGNRWVLYQVLKERLPHQSISHKEMPTWEQHLAFVASRPYLHWYEVQADHPAGGGLTSVGTIYLTKQREIGIGILTEYRGLGFAREAIHMLLEMHPGRALANINPGNEASIKLFAGLGFKHIQDTYELA